MWELRFEMSEDYRHKSLVGEVPPAALEWLESHWEVLPRDGWCLTGTLTGGSTGKTAKLAEVEQLLLTEEGGEVRVARTFTYPEEEVDLTNPPPV